MDKRQWLECTDPQSMLAFLHLRASERKRRLLATACCRRVWELLTHVQSRRALKVAERYADGAATASQLDDAEEEAEQAFAVVRETGLNAASHAADAVDVASCRDVGWDIAGDAARNAANAVREAASRRKRTTAHQSELLAQLGLVRCIFGNPFRPVCLSAGSLAWRDGLLRRLAEAAYQERQLPAGVLDPGRLAVLADALEEAGCSDPNILGHLRSPGPHVRGCHVLDAILSKE